MIIMLPYQEYFDYKIFQDLSPDFVGLDYQGTQQWNHLSNFGNGQYKEHEVL